MKRKLTLLLVCLMCLPMALAAEWGEGLGPQQPYPQVPAVNLEETMGYIVMYPNTNLPAERYCDVLEFYLPREDVELGEGTLTLYDDGGKVAEIPFDGGSVEVRPLEDSEKDGLIWGSGVCIEVHLPEALRFDDNYYVLMDEGCFTAASGAVMNPPITSNEAWKPMVSGEFGVSGLRYTGDGEGPHPAAGDTISMDLVLGGEATVAVIYCEDGGVSFETLEYAESTSVTGEMLQNSSSWGVVFLNDAGEAVDMLALGW